MDNQKNSILKQAYHQPQIKRVVLDNEISLALESNPAEGPNEGQTYNSPEYLNQRPFDRKLV